MTRVAIIRAQRLDQHVLAQHPHLQSDAICFHMREYTARAGYAHSETNDLISNFKKSVTKTGSAEYKWKTWAIDKIAQELAGGMGSDWFNAQKVTWVPMPPSKAKSDPEYDDRLWQVLNNANQLTGGNADVREILAQRISTSSASSGGGSRNPLVIAQNLYVPPHEQAKPPAPVVCVLDDVLTTGGHFEAAWQVIHATWPAAVICGCFVARCVSP